jgi:hypothetical protein
MRVWVEAGIDRGSGLDKMFIEIATKNLEKFVSCSFLGGGRRPSVAGTSGSETRAERGRPSVARTSGSETRAERGRPSVAGTSGSETSAELGGCWARRMGKTGVHDRRVNHG